MKLRTLLILALVAFTLMLMNEFGYADKRNRVFEVTVGTISAVVGGGPLPGRVYYKVENTSTAYDMKRSTGSIGSSGIGAPLYANGGWWEDMYNVYQSSWYYIITGGGPANVAPYTGTIIYHERD